MPKINYEVVLSPKEIDTLKSITNKGAAHTARTIMHANILIKTNNADPKNKLDNSEIADLFNISPTTVNEVRKTYAKEGLDGVDWHFTAENARIKLKSLYPTPLFTESDEP